MKENPLLRLENLGQSIWLDYLRRGEITSGELKQLIDNIGITGVTSNPTIFERAIVGSHDYDAAIEALVLADKSEAQIYQTLAIEDIQQAADLLRPVYDRLDGRDGFVSLEVSPYLAHNVKESLTAARRLWTAINRPNIFIKIPATSKGLRAVEQLVSEGININITLLFGIPRYRQVIEAYLAGLETRLAKGYPIDRVTSVASFFLSRIDTLVDAQLEEKIKHSNQDVRLLETLPGEVAIASARVAYQIYKNIFSGERFNRLAQHGARPQRLLWASTSTKNPAYSDIKYVEALIGPDTINTLPKETLWAYRDHGHPAPRLEEDVARAKDILCELPKIGIDMEVVTRQLENEGIEKFNQSFRRLMVILQKERAAMLQEPIAIDIK